MTSRHDLTPFDIAEAREAARLASARQAGAETAMREAYTALAEAERSYRVALAKERTRQHAENGVAWTATDDVARGEKHVADLRYARDIAKGVAEAASSALWRHTADRRDVTQFIRWSLQRELAEAGGDVREPDGELTTFGRRAA